MLLDEETEEEIEEFHNYLRMFFEASEEDSLIKEVSLIAERWKWSDETVRSLPTGVRRKYVEEIIGMYEREKEEYDKASRSAKSGK